MSINNCVYCRGAGLTEVGFPRHRARHRSSGEWLPEERGTEEAEEGEGPREAVGSAGDGGSSQVGGASHLTGETVSCHSRATLW